MPGPRNQKKRAANGKKSKRTSASKAALFEAASQPEPPPGSTHPEQELDASLRALSLGTAVVGVVGPKESHKHQKVLSIIGAESILPQPNVPLRSPHKKVLSITEAVPIISQPNAPQPSPTKHVVLTISEGVPLVAQPNVLLPSPAEAHSHYVPGDELPPPSIEDPGSGPRVRDSRAFLLSPFAVRPADAADAPLCAELAQDEVLLMVKELLPEDLAIIVWYNRTRRSSRVCPVCQRLYTLGDILPDQLGEAEEDTSGTHARVGGRNPSPLLAREQALSGLCSPVCFALAAYNYPNVVHYVWGASGTRPWRLLASPTRHEADKGLGLAVRMTRRADLGLGQLLGLEEEDREETEWEDGGWEEWNAPPSSLVNLEVHDLPAKAET